MIAPRAALLLAAAAVTSASCGLLYDYGDYRAAGHGTASGGATATGGAGGTPMTGSGGATSSSSTGSTSSTSSTGGGDGGDGGCGCPADEPCLIYECNSCMPNAVAAGTFVDGAGSGDCQKHVCDGGGNVIMVADDMDTPGGDSECATWSCNAGVPTLTSKANGTACSTGHCFSGTCSECGLASDCAAQDCKDATCSAGICMYQTACLGSEMCCGGSCKPAPCTM